MINQLPFPNIEEDIIASCIRRQVRLCESLIDAIERRDMSRQQIHDYLKIAQKNIQALRKALNTRVSSFRDQL